jgi:hypothetical protein
MTAQYYIQTNTRVRELNFNLPVVGAGGELTPGTFTTYS